MPNKTTCLRIVDPIDIKIRRWIAKLLKREDKKVVQYDKKVMEILNDVHRLF